jgi:hypothetical protein
MIDQSSKKSWKVYNRKNNKSKKESSSKSPPTNESNHQFQYSINNLREKLYKFLNDDQNYRVQTDYVKNEYQQLDGRLSTLVSLSQQSDFSKENHLPELNDLTVEINILREETRIKFVPKSLEKRIHGQIKKL